MKGIMMYGKHFSSMYEGSMVGAGACVFAVWGYCISNADPDLHTVRLHPKLLATILGETEDEIKNAIKYLADKDDNSCCTDEEGRRLVNTSGLEYLVVSHSHYREIKNSADRREYMRNYMRKRRADPDTDADTDTGVKKCKTVNVYTDEFLAFWAIYPKKKAKATAFRAWKKATDMPTVEELIRIIEAHKLSNDWRKDKGQYIPHPATWLNGGGWDDEATETLRPRGNIT